MALGMTFQSLDEDRYGYTVRQLRARLIGLLGGRAAEEIVIGDVSTGAESDLDRVAMISRMMVGRWGMSPAIGPLAVLPREQSYPGLDGRLLSEEVRQRVDAEVRRIVDECYRDAPRCSASIVTGCTATALLEHETLDEEWHSPLVGLRAAGRTLTRASGAEEREDREDAPVVVGARRRPNLPKMLVTCFSTARSVTNSRSAIAWFVRPSAIS